MAPKKIKKIKKKEELPSFLHSVTEVLDGPYSTKPADNVLHLGPIFFGCYDYQPIFHHLKLGPDKDLHKPMTSTENILRHAFLPKPEIVKPQEPEKFKLAYCKPPKIFTDDSPHTGTGFRRIFRPEVTPYFKCFGNTKSVIVAEASEEIPVRCGRRSYIKRLARRKCKYVMLSDIWERNRKYSSYKERIAHAHFLKHFVMKEVIGPPIPDSITITQLPSKRKTGSQICLELNKKTKKPKESVIKTEKPDENVDTQEQETPMTPTTEEAASVLVILDSENVEKGEADEGSAVDSKHSVTHSDEGIFKKEDEEVYTKIGGDEEVYTELEGHEEVNTKLGEDEEPEVIDNEETEN